MTSNSFKMFLNESSNAKEFSSIDEFVREVKLYCSQFLKNATVEANLDHFLMRGDSEWSAGTMLSQTPRSDRKPKDMSDTEHYILNQYLQSRFDFSYRSGGVFCTMNPLQARAYGSLSFIFPTDDYTLLASNSLRDAFDAMNDLSSLLALDHFDTVESKEAFREKLKNPKDGDNLKEIFSYLDKYKFFETQKLDKIVISSEITLRCKKYYSIFMSKFQFKDFAKEHGLFE